MGLSRLENFLKSIKGNIIYVDSSGIDSTDEISNTGNSLARPFKSIQRALIEAARFSYQSGKKNDRFNKTTVIVYPGEYIIDNRPGWVVNTSSSFYLRSGETQSSLDEWSKLSNFNLESIDNELYKLNSVYGGVIIPRGVSIVGIDLRKTIIRPRYVPNPTNDLIERSCIFRITGGSYFKEFTVLDGNPNGFVFKDYSKNIFSPNFSHHKLSVFEFADGVNPVKIDDTFLTYSSTSTDLEMYYQKVSLVYGPTSGREILNTGTIQTVDIEPVTDEYRIVGSRGDQIGITSIRAGDGVTATNKITVTLANEFSALSVDTPIQISGVNSNGYDGQFNITSVLSSTQIQYTSNVVPTNPLPSISGATLNISVDTINSASPYIFGCSLRSVYGLCGLLADGKKSDGFKSVVVSQFTGIGLQKDDNAFIKYDNVTGSYKDSTTISNLHTDSEAIFKPSYENFHILAKNDAFLQLVSVFTIGYAKQFVTESGGELSITNSNSNFGAKSLSSFGYRNSSFSKDDNIYLTHIIPPKLINLDSKPIDFIQIDVGLTTSASSGAATTNRLYLYNQTNIDSPPVSVIDGYRIGSKLDEKIFSQISSSGITSIYSASVIMPSLDASENSSFKSYKVQRELNNTQNSISGNIITLTQPHKFESGESIRIYSENGHLPDGLINNTLYYAITNSVSVGIGSTQIKVAQTKSDALNNTPITINEKGGVLTVVSKVSDKNCGDIGHPVQFDTSRNNWYINVSSNSNSNTLYNAIKTFGVSGIGAATPRTYFTRVVDNRRSTELLYNCRIVIPKNSNITGRNPLDGFIIQDSSTTSLTSTELPKYYGTSVQTLTTESELRNPRFISNATWATNEATITTELPHDCVIGSSVEIKNIKSTNNTNGTFDLGFNGKFVVTQIINPIQFKYSLTTNPGTFTSNVSVRDTSLPYFRKSDFSNIYKIIKKQTLKQYKKGIQDGIYHVTLINCSNYPTVVPFNSLPFSQNIQDLIPKLDRDNPKVDLNPSRSFALPSPIGQVITNDTELSISKETIHKKIKDLNVGIGITNIVSNITGTSHTIYTSLDHKFNGISNLGIVTGGANYIQGNYYGVNLVGYAGSTVGKYGTARIEVGAGGTVISVQVMGRGCAYGIGNTVQAIIPSGIGTTTGFVPATLSVLSIQNNINDSIEISGADGNSSVYNSNYRLTNVIDPRTIIVSSSSTISTTILGAGVTELSNSVLSSTGKALPIQSFSYNSSTGIATIGFSTSHGLFVDNSLVLGGFNNSYFNKKVHITKLNSLTSLEVYVGKDGVGLSTSGSQLYVYRNAYNSQNGAISIENENINGRQVFNYSGISTVILSTLTSSDTSDQIIISNAVSNGFQLGDYLQINSEIFRIKKTVTSNTVDVFRSIFGSPRQTHQQNSVVYKIKVNPIEVRRYSTISAAGHTFEYVGFGPGNYSSAFPERQTRELTGEEVLLSQSLSYGGGNISYNAKNSNGEFFDGFKRINSITGIEETYNTSIPSFTGQDSERDVSRIGFNAITPDDVFINKTLTVEGGSKNNLLTVFNGPILINNKVTSTSPLGFEVSSLFINGTENISRNISISTQKPSYSGGYGDIVFNSTPNINSNVGWIYTQNNNWTQFGWINDKLYGVGISSNSGTIGFSTQVNFIGIGITVAVQYDSNTGISTVRISGNPKNAITIYTGVGNTSTLVGDVSTLKIASSTSGFGLNINSQYDSNTGFTTVFIENPLVPINFTNTLGKQLPKFTNRSSGSRIIYYDNLSSTSVDFASGVGNDDSLWYSVPKNDGSYAFKWFGGETEIAKLLSNGNFSVIGNITSNNFTSLSTTTSPISVASSIKVSNLNSDYLDGYDSSIISIPLTIPVRDLNQFIDGYSTGMVDNLGIGRSGGWFQNPLNTLGYIPFNKAGDVSVGICTFYQISDVINTNSFAGGALTVDFADGPIRYITQNTVSSLNITNVPTTNNRASNYTLIMQTTGTTTLPASFQINSNVVSIQWLNGISPSGTTIGTYFFGFTIMRVSSSWVVLGVFAKYS